MGAVAISFFMLASEEVCGKPKFFVLSRMSVGWQLVIPFTGCALSSFPDFPCSRMFASCFVTQGLNSLFLRYSFALEREAIANAARMFHPLILDGVNGSSIHFFPTVNDVNRIETSGCANAALMLR